MNINDLSPREREIVRAMVAGATTLKELSAKVGCAVGTIDVHLGGINRKLGTHGKLDIVLALYDLKEKI
jgi:DNA-binding CsgD family transcriptional regulator